MQKRLAILGLITLMLVVACAGSFTSRSKESGINASAIVEKEVLQALPEMARDQSVLGSPEAMLALPEPVVEREVVKEVVKEVAKSVAAVPARGLPGRAGEIGSLESEVAQLAQQRIIVRTVDMGLVVGDMSKALDTISEMAQESGGWVVDSNRLEKHRASISVRVPADRLEAAVLSLRDLAIEVEFEVSSSKDVTDEFVDTTARLKNLQATEEALLRLMGRAGKVEDALKVQKELTRVQGDIEGFQGRIKFLEQTSAFSLINVSLQLAPMDMSVDAGPDQTLSVGKLARFRATFRPPEGIEDFTFTWDFGDGSHPASGNRTAATVDGDIRVTATVAHVYEDDRDSPFIVEVEISGTGDAGVAEGTDAFIATVSKVPVIEVFAGEDRLVDEGEEVEFVGSFTRPEGLSALTFRWNFGDGTTVLTGSVEEGVTNIVQTHVYTDHRPFVFTATLTIMAQSDAGEVEASDTLSVGVTEPRGWVIAGFRPGDTTKTAVRALSGLGIGLGNAAIVLAIFSPVWIPVGALGVFLWRRRRARRRLQPTGEED